ncbi:hypothetical protein MN608_11805 [Microdochium nivale]|nr:hypothetical protein MN608_11805 [Microdochium nivale]
MKFFHLLTFAVAAAATPMLGFEVAPAQTKDLEKRQATNLAQVVLGVVNTAAATIDTSLDVISDTLATAGNNINVQVQAIIEANLNAIAGALTTGTAALAAAIAAATGNIGNAVAGFGLTQILQLVTAITKLVMLLTNLGVQLTATVNNLNAVAPAVLAALAAPFAAIQAAIGPFIKPIGDIINAVRGISATANLLLTGFDALVPGLIGILFNLLGGL